MGFFSKLFGKKPKVVEQKEIETKEVEAIPDTNSEYVFTQGEKTSYDCIMEAKSLNMDMRYIDNNYNSMTPRKFVIWFEGYKKNYKG